MSSGLFFRIETKKVCQKSLVGQAPQRQKITLLNIEGLHSSTMTKNRINNLSNHHGEGGAFFGHCSVYRCDVWAFFCFL